jgi:hypothetical protein
VDDRCTPRAAKSSSWLGFYLSPSRILLLMAAFFPILIGVSHDHHPGPRTGGLTLRALGYRVP